MRLIFASQKGGTGKSTAAVNVAACLAERGKKIILLDCDKKNSSVSLWASYREDSEEVSQVPCAEKSGRVDKLIEELSETYPFVITDTPGHDSAEMRSALLVADIVIVPIQASQFDLETMNHFYGLIEDSLIYNEKMKVYYYVSNASTHPRSKEPEELRTYMTDYPLIKPLGAVIHNRAAYKRSLPDGFGVVDLKDAKAIKEINSLTDAIVRAGRKK